MRSFEKHAKGENEISRLLDPEQKAFIWTELRDLGVT